MTDAETSMVDVSGKSRTDRVAVAKAVVAMTPETRAVVRRGTLEKGDALAAARVAGILAAKRTPELIPMCHQINLTSVDITFADHADGIEVRARVSATDRTGVEMEALTAVSLAALTIYDMIKAIERGAHISDVRLLRKSGGRSGDWRG